MSHSLRKKYAALLDREEGGRHTKVWGTKIAVCLVYPNTYRTGMANLGFQTVYTLLNGDPDCLCERAFLPDPGDETRFAPGSHPLCSLESRRPLSAFDIVAFSISFENDYPNILTILALAGLPLAAAARGAGEPLVIGGGVAVTLNPEPLADFFDLFLLGEGEETAAAFLGVYKTVREAPRPDLLAAFQRQAPGAYCPALYRIAYGSDHRIRAREPLSAGLPAVIRVPRLAVLDAAPAVSSLTTDLAEFGDMAVVEVSRGCGRGCRFCAAGYLYRPPRFRSGAALVPAFRKGLEEGRKIGLLGTAVADHPELPSLCRTILAAGGRLSISSLRTDRLTDELVALLAAAGVATVALAPEAGSQRLRDVIRKGITEEDIFAAADTLMRHGIANVRLYFMVGLPTETDEDIDAIMHLVRRLRHRERKATGGRRAFRLMTLSINQFIPKAATPFQWHPLAETTIVKKRIRKIVTGLRREQGVKVTHDLPKWNYIQALLSLGDRRVGDILLAVHRRRGNWAQAVKEVNVNPDFFVYRQKEAEEILPWDFIDHGVDKEYLWKEYRAAVANGPGPA